MLSDKKAEAIEDISERLAEFHRLTAREKLERAAHGGNS